MNDRFPAGGFPSGWYVIRSSGALSRGQLEKVHYFGRDMVLYRTESGEARLTDAICPHLGASLSLGQVAGENLVCAMHGFEFDGEGKCAKLAYGTRPPAKARLGVLPVHEVNDFIFAWYSPDGSEPTFRLEPLDWEGWTRLRHRRFEFAGHPQETTENSVDIGHFEAVHHYTASVDEAPVAEGAKLGAAYQVIRPLFGRRDRLFKVHAKFRILAHGLGYSMVQTEIAGLPTSMRFYINATPIDGERIHLNIAAAAKKVIPGLNLAMREVAYQMLQNDVMQDIPFWESKRYLERPLLAEGDGPIPIYRRWCRQFYPGDGRPETVA